MLTSKQRATLRGIASSYETILQVGKNGIGETLIQQVSDALRKRELIKLHVLENSELSAREAAEQLAEAGRTGTGGKMRRGNCAGDWQPLCAL